MNVIRKTAMISRASLRCLSTTSSKASWIFSSDAAKTSAHSKLLTDKETVYQIVSDTVAPRDWEDYVAHKGALMQRANDTEGIRWEHLASWHFRYGDVVFRAMHLIKFDGGWSDVDTTRRSLKTDEKYQKEYNAGLKLITQQSNEFLKSFSYWPEPDKRTGDNIYDVRTYYVKPGSMYDWGNYWSRGIKCRTRVRPDIPYAGLFSQLGQLHTIHHIWVYSSLDDRKKCRENTWHEADWNEVVANTVPLIRTMSTRILEPLPFSPTQ